MLPVFFVERISGLRKGELAALLWSNLEVERKALLVSKWVVQGGGIKVTRPKTATYARKISIPQEAVNLLVQEQAADPSRAQAVLEMLAEYVHRFPEANQRETLLAVARTELSGGLRTATRKLRWKRK